MQQVQQQGLTGSGSGNVEDSVGTTRNIDDSMLKSIGKAGFKHFVGSSSKTAAKPTVQHQHHYYYNSEHPRQSVLPGYPWGGYPQVPQPQPPRPWVPPYSQWPYGWGHWGGGGGYPGNPGNPGFPGTPGYPGLPGPGYPGLPGPGYPGYPGYPYPGYPRYPGYPNYPGYPAYPGYPGYPWYRNAENEELDESQVQPEVVSRSIPASYQARVLASTSKSNNNVLPLYQLLNLAHV